MENTPFALFLSPHFDDIALSCGGVAARLSRSGARCACLTVFAAPAPRDVPLSSYALGLHAQWEADAGMAVSSINEVRREEERASTKLLGLEPVWLDFPDAPYRRSESGQHFYTSDAELFGRVASEEKSTLVPRVAAEIRRVVEERGIRGPVRVFAPLGVGHHVDHQIAHWAARSLGPRYGVLFYEDYPYAGREGALEARLRELGLRSRTLLTPIDDLIGVKIAAIGRYKSQLGVLFGSSEAMPAAVRAFSEGVAADSHAMQYAERVWQLPSVYRLVDSG